MSQHIHAIFENGILRPLEPLHLPDQIRVKVTIESAQDRESPENVKAQQVALQDLWREVDASPQTNNNDGWSAAQHDDLLYDSDA